jgi:hypothetical protein
MPKTSLKVEEHKIQKAKFPTVDVHFHGGSTYTRVQIWRSSSERQGDFTPPDTSSTSKIVF